MQLATQEEIRAMLNRQTSGRQRRASRPQAGRIMEALRAYGRDLPAPETEYPFILRASAGVQARYRTPKTNKPRAWRFDFAWPQYQIAVEYDGGVAMPGGGRHRQESDQQKISAAVQLGWRVIQLNATTVRCAENAVDLIRAALALRGWRAGR